MEKCAFIDIFTTQNDLYGKNNCPIQFCTEIFSNSEVFDSEKLMNPTRRKMFNIIPDESILIPGFITSGYKDDDVKTSDYNGLELKDALTSIYDILCAFKNKDVFIIGYNHINYDLDILNSNFKRVLNLEPIVFEKNKLIDVFKLAEIMIPITEIGNYSMESVMTYLLNDCNKTRNLRLTKSTATDIKITKMILTELIKRASYTTLSDISNKINSPREIDIFQSGKYKGAKLSDIIKSDAQYCGWLLKNKDMNVRHPNLIASLRKLMNSTVV